MKGSIIVKSAVIAVIALLPQLRPYAVMPALLIDLRGLEGGRAYNILHRNNHKSVSTNIPSGPLGQCRSSAMLKNSPAIIIIILSHHCVILPLLVVVGGERWWHSLTKHLPLGSEEVLNIRGSCSIMTMGNSIFCCFSLPADPPKGQWSTVQTTTSKTTTSHHHASSPESSTS